TVAMRIAERKKRCVMGEADPLDGRCEWGECGRSPPHAVAPVCFRWRLPESNPPAAARWNFQGRLPEYTYRRAAHRTLPGPIRHRRLGAAVHDNSAHARLAGIAEAVAVPILEHDTRDQMAIEGRKKGRALDAERHHAAHSAIRVAHRSLFSTERDTDRTTDLE